MCNPYADEVFYRTEYIGVPVPLEDFPRFAKRASDLIDLLTEHKIPEKGFDELPENIQLLIKKACCAQIEYYQVEGIEADISGVTQSGQSVSIGSFSYSGGGSASVSKQTNRAAPGCLAFLDATGLLKKRRVNINVI